MNSETRRSGILGVLCKKKNRGQENSISVKREKMAGFFSLKESIIVVNLSTIDNKRCSLFSC